MKDRGEGGVIINITSNQQKGCWEGSLVYGPVKAALMHFTEAAAYELSEFGNRVVAIAPGLPAPQTTTLQVGWKRYPKNLKKR